MEKANEIFTVLGEEYSISLATTKYVDGLLDDHTKLMTDSRFDEAYKFPEVVKAYAKCTKSRHRTEMASQQLARKTEAVKSETELMMKPWSVAKQAEKQNSRRDINRSWEPWDHTKIKFQREDILGNVVNQVMESVNIGQGRGWYIIPVGWLGIRSSSVVP